MLERESPIKPPICTTTAIFTSPRNIKISAKVIHRTGIAVNILRFLNSKSSWDSHSVLVIPKILSEYNFFGEYFVSLLSL